MSELQSLVAEMNISPSVQFLGDRSDVPELMNALDVLAVPSFTEGLGTSVVEAQANGLPCIVSSGVPRSVDTGAGLVQFLPLLEEVWCEHFSRPPDRQPTAWRKVVEHGYDAYDVVERITEFYTKAIKYGL
jgi:glycosyltransferase involved in cell wall biosynthesis